MSRFEKIINLIKDHVPPEVLREVWIELNRLDTEAKREILRAAREEEK